MTGADKAIRYSTIGAVSVVALVAGFVSYRHALQVVTVHGESGLIARAYPLTIDGLIYAASMVLLNAARRGSTGPPSRTSRSGSASLRPWPPTWPQGWRSARSALWSQRGQPPPW